MSRLCLILAEKDLGALERKLDACRSSSPYVEVRFDYLEHPQIPRVPSKPRPALIATCRRPEDGGRFQGSETDRLQLLGQAARSGFDWVDLEQDAAEPPDLPADVRIVRSHHDFGRFPSDLDAAWSRLMVAKRVDVRKMAVRVESTDQLARLLSWMEKGGEGGRIVIGMGPFGQPSRSLGFFLGNEWTYASEQDQVAPGLFTLRQAHGEWGLVPRTTKPTIYGVLGNPVAHSMSPALHNRLFNFYGVNAVYLPFHLDNVDPWFDYLAKSRVEFGGFSVTLPFKKDVVKYAGFGAAEDRALNTLVKTESGWRGLNTDYFGFLNPLLPIPRARTTALVLGTGGVAHTVVKALTDHGVRVTVVGRAREKAGEFAERYGCATAVFDDLPLAADWCINCTSVGQQPDIGDSPLKDEDVRFELVYDLVYRPERTKLIRQAESKGIRTITGTRMFIEQAALQFQAWTGVDPDRALVRQFMAELGPGMEAESR